jgi:phage gp29-like protein
MEAAIQGLVEDLVDANFPADGGGTGQGAPEFYFLVRDEDLGPWSETLQRLQAMGAKIPAWYVHRKFAVPMPEDDDEVLSPISGVRLPGPPNPSADSAAAAEFAEPPGGAGVADGPGGAGGDPREKAIDAAMARTPDAYRGLIEELKKKRRRTRSGLISNG